MVEKKKNLNEIVAETREDGTIVTANGVEIPPLTNEELDEAVGGNWTYDENSSRDREGYWIEVGDRITVSGSLYKTSYKTGYSGQVNGKFVVERSIQGRPAPILLATSAGWVEGKSCKV